MSAYRRIPDMVQRCVERVLMTQSRHLAPPLLYHRGSVDIAVGRENDVAGDLREWLENPGLGKYADCQNSWRQVAHSRSDSARITPRSQYVPYTAEGKIPPPGASFGPRRGRTGQVRSDKGEITPWQRIFPKLSILTVPATMRFSQ